MPIQPVHAEKLATGKSAGRTNRKSDGRRPTAMAQATKATPSRFGHKG